MEKQSNDKKYPIFRIMLGIVFLALIITILMQYRQIDELKRELGKHLLSGRTIDKESVLKPVKPPSEIFRTSEKNISDKEKIEILEARISDMQAWQDYLEDTLEKQKKEEEFNNDVVNSMIKSVISERVDSFAEEVGLSSDIKTKLYNILVEKESEMQDSFSGEISREDRKKELEYVVKKYDEMISDLLDGNYSAYKEYLKVQNERTYVTDFNNSMLVGDIQLEKQQEQRLITAIYNENQAFKNVLEEKARLLHDGNLSDVEKKRVYLEALKSLYSRYTDYARDILSESQLKKFQKYLDIELSNQEMNANMTISLMGETD